jgi:hypothetical protein
MSEGRKGGNGIWLFHISNIVEIFWQCKRDGRYRKSKVFCFFFSKKQTFLP